MNKRVHLSINEQLLDIVKRLRLERRWEKPRSTAGGATPSRSYRRRSSRCWPSFAKMTVADICRRAEINRGTFYLHYEDKYALLDALIDEALAAAPPLEGG